MDDPTNLTFDKLLKIRRQLLYVYYLASDYIPKETPPAPGQPPEPGVFRVDIEGYQVWLMHSDFLPGFQAAAEASGRRVVDFRTMDVPLSELIPGQGLWYKMREEARQHFGEELLKYRMRLG